MTKEKIVNIADCLVEYSLYGLLFFIPISVAIIETFSGIIAFSFLLKKFIVPDFSFVLKNKLIYFFLGLFVLFIGLSLFNSGPFLVKSLRAFFSKWLLYIVVCLAAADTFKSWRQIKKGIIVLFFSAVLASFSGLSQYFFNFEFLRGRGLRPVRGALAATSAFNHYNNFAAYLVLLIPISLALNLLQFKKSVYKKGVVFLPVLLTGALLFTFSRGGWLGFLTGAGLLIVLLGKYKIGLVLAGSFAGILFLLPQLRERFLFTFTQSGDAGRFAIWQGAWAIIKENPFLGKGLGTFTDYFPRYTSGLGSQPAHNCYLQIWAESGVFSLISFLGFVSLLLYFGLNTVRKKPKSNLSMLSVGISCGLFGFLAHSFFDVQLYLLQLRVLFWLTAGILLAVINLMRENNFIE